MVDGFAPKRYTDADDTIYSVSQKISRAVFRHFFPNGWEYLIKFLHTYYAFLSTLDYNFFYSVNSNFDEVMPY